MSFGTSKITRAELEHSDSPKSEQSSYAPLPDNNQEPHTSPRNPDTPPDRLAIEKRWRIAGLVFAVLVLTFLGYLFLKGSSRQTVEGSSRQTVEEFRQEAIAKMNGELADSNSPMRKRIEAAHGPYVTVYSAKVKTMAIDTLDGSNYADHGKNIATVTMEIEFRWDGLIDKGGTTILETVRDWQNEKETRSIITHSDAKINIEDPDFWNKLASWIFE